MKENAVYIRVNMILEMKDGEKIGQVKEIKEDPNLDLLHIHFKDRSGYRVVDPDNIRKKWEKGNLEL